MSDRFRFRPVLAGLSAAIVAASLATACTAEQDVAGARSETPPRSGGTLTFATDTDLTCLDPQQSPAAAALLTGRGVVDSLVAQSPETGEIRPWLASSWQVSSDATRFTFTLRRGVTFSDGAPLTAAAVKTNFDRIVSPATKSLLAASFFTGYAGSTVQDPETITVRFAQPNAGFLQAASTAFLGLQSPATFTDGPQATCRKVIGSGPFVLSDYVPQQKVVLTRRADYNWAPDTAEHQGTAYLEKVTISIVPETGVRMGSLRSGQVDAVAGVPPREAAGLSGDRFQLLKKEQPGIAYSLFLNSTRTPWTDAAVRRAIAKAIDTKQIAAALYQDQYAQATSILTPKTPGYVPVLPEGQFDQAEAGRLLDAAGWRMDGSGFRSRNGARLTLTWTYVSPSREQRDVLAQLVQQQLKAVGVAVELEPAAQGDVIARQIKGDWELSDLSFTRADGDVLRTVLRPTTTGSRPVVPDAELGDHLAKAVSTMNPASRHADYERAQRHLIDEAFAIPVYNPTYLLGSTKAVRGLGFDVQGLPTFYDTWIVR